MKAKLNLSTCTWVEPASEKGENELSSEAPNYVRRGWNDPNMQAIYSREYLHLYGHIR